MPLYFAYGSNLDRAGMACRCPDARPVTPAVLADHRFFVMPEGYASIRTERHAMVHGLLWDLPEDDIAALDAYEEIDEGLYRKAILPVTTADGDVAAALVYIGRSQADGAARPGYMEAVIAAATTAGLPVRYVQEMRRWLPQKRV